MIDETAIRSRYEAMRPGLDERERRLLAAAEARTAGYGGVSAVARATGIARSTIDRGFYAIGRWRETMGCERYPTADRLMITADGGGSNGSRVRLWKIELQRLADATGLTLVVCHYPPGTSKWNKIEHRLFCHITQNWRGRPLTSRTAVVELIAATTTKTGLKVRCELDTKTYLGIAGQVLTFHTRA